MTAPLSDHIHEVHCLVDDLSPLALAILCRIGSMDDECGYYSFGALAKIFDSHRSNIKAAFEQLNAHDLVDFQTGLMTQEGCVAGSGYARSERGESLYSIYKVIYESVSIFQLVAA